MKLMTTREMVIATEVNHEKLTAEYRILQKFKINDLADLAIKVINEHGSLEQLHTANKVADLVLFMLEEKKLIRPGVQQSFVDILLCSTLLYNIKEVKADNWRDVFEIRDIIMEAAKEFPEIPEQGLLTICETIEGQLGEDMPIKACRPNPNTPGELFALAVAITERFNK